MKVLLCFVTIALAIAFVSSQQCDCSQWDTCCQNTSGGYGCCPYVKATCCADKEHCCPNGYTCDLNSGECVPANPPKPLHKTAEDCGCSSEDTCCSIGSGQYGCCPYPNAVCCSDHEHCCPSGYSCDLNTGECSKNALPQMLRFRK